MDKVTVSAPGKLMLFGEHAVIYNQPCIVTAVNQRIFVTIKKTTTGKLELKAPDVKISNYEKSIQEIGKGEIPREARFVEFAVNNLIKEKNIETQGLNITTKSEFSPKFGFGSSSASVVCVIKGLAEIYKLKLNEKEIFNLSYKTVLGVQGKGSGFDVAASVYGGTLYFLTGGKIIERMNIEIPPLTVGYSGVKADTVTLINEVLNKTKNHLKIITDIYYLIGKLVKKSKKSMLIGDWKTTGELMNFNQGLLESLGVSTPLLSQLIYASRSNGAYGAKLSGAGGGDCMIALVSDKNKKNVRKSIEKLGATIIKVKFGAQGVRIEKKT